MEARAVLTREDLKESPIALTKENLPDERKGLSHRVTIGTHTLYIQTGEYEDGKLGELFLHIDKHGGKLKVYGTLAMMISIGLQHGVPLKTYVDHLRAIRCEPQGPTNNPDVMMASSVSDYIAKWLENYYLQKSEKEDTVKP